MKSKLICGKNYSLQKCYLNAGAEIDLFYFIVCTCSPPQQTQNKTLVLDLTKSGPNAFIFDSVALMVAGCENAIFMPDLSGCYCLL